MVPKALCSEYTPGEALWGRTLWGKNRTWVGPQQGQEPSLPPIQDATLGSHGTLSKSCYGSEGTDEFLSLLGF